MTGSSPSSGGARPAMPKTTASAWPTEPLAQQAVPQPSRQPSGQSPDFCPEPMAAALCAGLHQGLSLRTLCAQNNMPALETVMGWLEQDEKFRNRYHDALKRAGRQFGFDIVELADTASPEELAHTKLRIEARKWVATRLCPELWDETFRRRQASAAAGLHVPQLTPVVIMSPSPQADLPTPPKRTP